MDFKEIPTMDLVSMADRERRTHIGHRLELCSITNAKSGNCSEDCKFCAQSRSYKTDSLIYPLKDKDVLMMEAKEAKEIGVERFGIVTSGRGLSKKEVIELIKTIKEIRANVGIGICCSLGMIDIDSLISLKEAGLVRYHHNIETSPEFFPRVVSTHRFEDRIRMIRMAKEIGLEVCSGGIFGLGEDEEDRIRMATILKELDVASIPINILIPIPGTPFENMPPLSIRDIIRSIAIFRIILPDKTIKIAAGRESILKDFQGLAFMSGANGMIIGGYLTIKGRDIKEDKMMVREIEGLWTG